jgi:hypothetical protein
LPSTTSGEETTGTLNLYNQNEVVMSADSVHATNYLGSVGGHFSVGVDPVNQHIAAATFRRRNQNPLA